MIPWGAIFAAAVAFFRALFGIKTKDPEVVEAKHEATVARKQTEIMADSGRPDAVASLHRHDF